MTSYGLICWQEEKIILLLQNGFLLKCYHSLAIHATSLQHSNPKKLKGYFFLAQQGGLWSNYFYIKNGTMIFILNAFQVSRKILTRVSQKNVVLFHILSYFLWIYDICFMVMLYFFCSSYIWFNTCIFGRNYWSQFSNIVIQYLNLINTVAAMSCFQ